MGRQGNYSHREKKKTRKEPRKAPSVSIVTPPVEVEVIKKGKQREGRRPDEEE
jgi:hypothetical protein